MDGDVVDHFIDMKVRPLTNGPVENIAPKKAGLRQHHPQLSLVIIILVLKVRMRDADGDWFMELRYGNKAIKLSGENTAVEVGGKEKLTTVITTLTDAVKAGELDKALAAAKKERMAMLRKS